MILIDRREKPNKRDKQELRTLIRRFGVPAEMDTLEFGDFAFEGFDDKGSILVGIERKRLHDILNCVDDSRLNAHQRLGMKQMYRESWLVVEGLWRFHDPKGLLMEGDSRGAWWECRPGGRPVLYSKLRRFLFSVARSGSFVDILETRDMTQTAYDVVELYHYYQKRNHTSLLTKQKMNIASLQGRPPLVRRWAEELDGIGPRKAEVAARLFKTPDRLANSEPLEWLAVPGVGMKTAEDVVAQILGRTR